MDRLSTLRMTAAALLAATLCAAGPDRGFAADPEAAGAVVTMRHFNAPWPAVLGKLAKETGSHLVMNDVPPGRFSRFDRGRYTRGEAVRMFNEQLQADGYRILEQGPNLVVISDRSVRQNYRRPIAPEAGGAPRPAPSYARADRPEPAARTREFGSALPPRDAAARPVGRTARDVAEGYRDEAIRHADLENPATPVLQLTGGEVAAAEEIAADAAEPKTVNVRVGRGKAKAVARTLMLAVGDQARLVDRGPGGFPAFAAHRPDPRRFAEPGAAGAKPELTGDPVFSVGVDEAQDELVVTAPGARADRVAEVLRAIDQGPPTNKAMRVVAGGPQTLAVSRKLTPVLAKLARYRKQNGQAAPAQPPAGNGQNAQPGRQNPAGRNDGAGGGQPETPANPGDLQRIIENIRSDVQVEEFGDSGVLIIRGNRDDVAAVAQVIDQLERLSAGLQPQIQLLLLRHVDSVPLAALLTEVYGELARLRNQGEEAPSRVTVLPVGKPNAVVVIASEADLEAVATLAEQLDQPVPAGTQLEVFQLENAIATQVAGAIEAFYEDRQGLFPQVRVFADIRTNSLVVNAAPNGLAEVRKLVRDLDRGESGLVSRIEVVALEFATAELLADTINEALRAVLNPAQAQQGGGGGNAAGGNDAQALQAARSVIVEYVTATGEVGRSGLLADVSVAPDVTGNRLILTAPERTMPLLVALVAALDAPGGARADVKVFTLQNADAEAAVETLRELFETDAGADAPAGVTLDGTADSGSNLVPLRFSFDARTQTVLAIGGEDALAIVEAVLLRLDDENRNRQQFFTVKLVNTPAEQVAASLGALIDARRTLLGEVPGLLSPVELIERDVVVIPEVFSNRLLIFASSGSKDDILELIREIDEAPPQVAIQALLVQVTLDNTDEVGVELGFQDSTLFGRSLAAGDAAPLAFNNANPLPQGVFNPATLATQGLSNFGLGRANADLGFGGFVFSASSQNISVLLRALAAKRQVHVLSRPQVTVLDQQTADIQVGQTVPVVDGVVINNNSTTPTVTRVPSGLILRVTPRISPDGTVFMQVGAQNNNFDLAGVPIFVDPTTGATINSPIENVAATNTFVSVPNGQTVVIGGIITKSEAVNERKVPYVGDIPYLGQLFRTDSTVTTRTELLIFLTPRIIYNDSDFELVKQVESDRMHYLEHEAEALHGPLFGVPPSPGTGGYFPETFGPAEFPPGAFAPGAFPPGAFGPPTDGLGTPVPAPAPGEFCPPGAPAPPAGSATLAPAPDVRFSPPPPAGVR